MQDGMVEDNHPMHFDCLPLCFAMWIDKRRAKGHRRRISEKVLFLFPLLGGSGRFGILRILFLQ